MIKTIEWTDDGVVMIDQRLLPTQEVYQTFSGYEEVAQAIRSMVIRGAPAIGVAAAMGIALGAKQSTAKSLESLDREFQDICETLSATRPTAVNLFWAVERMKRAYHNARSQGLDALRSALGAGIVGDLQRGYRSQPGNRALRPGADSGQRQNPDALQCRCACDRGLRNRSRRDPGCRGSRQADSGLCRRNQALSFRAPG